MTPSSPGSSGASTSGASDRRAHSSALPTGVAQEIVVARYLDRRCRRELVLVVGDGLKRCLIDRASVTGADRRLVGELAPEERSENAVVLARDYLHTTHRACVTYPPPPCPADAAIPTCLVDADGNTYTIEEAHRAEHGTDLRWVRTSPLGVRHPVTLHEVVGAMEDYEPALAMTEGALAARPEVAGGVLRRQQARLASSRLVLNRKLREAVQAEMRRGTTLAEIAARCGRTRSAASGRLIGEGAWVARRVGLSRVGQAAAHRWIDHDVLAEVADAIGLTPDDPELRW